MKLTFKQHCFGRINRGVYMSTSKRLYYKQLKKKTLEKEKKKEVEGDQIKEESNLFQNISISEDLQSLNVKESMGKQKAYALVINEAMIGEDVDDYVDENNVINSRS